MKKIFELIAVAIFKVDTVLYKTFGFVSSFRSQSWARQNRRLQQDLDREHSLRDYLNARHSTSYTTKQALALEDNVL
jgi:protoheme ferro-lyase